MSAPSIDAALASTLPGAEELRRHLAEMVEQSRSAVLDAIAAPSEEAYERATLQSVAVVHLIGYLRLAAAREEGGDGR